MAESARVKSIEVIRSFRETLARFGEDSSNAIEGVEMEIRRVQDWLQHEMPSHWRRQIRHWDQEMARARSELHRKNLARTEGYIPDTSAEKEAMRIAKRRMEDAERKLEQTRRWVPLLQHAVSEYQGQARPLANVLVGDLVRSLELLDRMIGALDDYVSTPPPRAAGRPVADMARAGGPEPDPGPEPEPTTEGRGDEETLAEDRAPEPGVGETSP